MVAGSGPSGRLVLLLLLHRMRNRVLVFVDFSHSFSKICTDTFLSIHIYLGVLILKDFNIPPKHFALICSLVFRSQTFCNSVSEGFKVGPAMGLHVLTQETQAPNCLSASYQGEAIVNCHYYRSTTRCSALLCTETPCRCRGTLPLQEYIAARFQGESSLQSVSNLKARHGHLSDCRFIHQWSVRGCGNYLQY